MTFFREETCKFRGISLHRVILHEIPDHISAFHDHIHAGHIDETSHIIVLHTGFLILSDNLISVIIEAVFPLVIVIHLSCLKLQMDLFLRIHPTFEERISAEQEAHGTKDTLMALLVGAAVYMAFGQLETSTRILQAVLCGLVVAVVLRRMNERQNGETSGKKTNSISADKNQALQLLESSGLKGERCTLNFYEDTFTVERPGIITEYQYEGIAWIKETSKYYMIFWNRSLAIPVEKAGFYRGKKETFGGFLEKRCNKVIEKVKNA